MEKPKLSSSTIENFLSLDKTERLDTKYNKTLENSFDYIEGFDKFLTLNAKIKEHIAEIYGLTNIIKKEEDALFENLKRMGLDIYEFIDLEHFDQNAFVSRELKSNLMLYVYDKDKFFHWIDLFIKYKDNYRFSYKSTLMINKIVEDYFFRLTHLDPSKKEDQDMFFNDFNIINDLSGKLLELTKPQIFKINEDMNTLMKEKDKSLFLAKEFEKNNEFHERILQCICINFNFDINNPESFNNIFLDSLIESFNNITKLGDDTLVKSYCKEFDKTHISLQSLFLDMEGSLSKDDSLSEEEKIIFSNLFKELSILSFEYGKRIVEIRDNYFLFKNDNSL